MIKPSDFLKIDVFEILEFDVLESLISRSRHQNIKNSRSRSPSSIFKNSIFVSWIIGLLIILSTITSTTPILATDSSTSGNATVSATTAIDQKAQDLLDKVATKVAELSAKLQRSYHGQIKSLGTASLVATTPQGDKTITTNDATNFYRIRAGNRTEINFAALKVGDDIGAVGIIDPVSTDLTARQIIAKIARLNAVGTIQGIDKTVATVQLADKSTVKIDLDGATLKQLTQSGKIITAKLSDFKTNTKIFAIAVSPDEKTGVYSILKALTIPNNLVK